MTQLALSSTLFEVQNRLRFKLALGFFGISVLSATVPIVVQAAVEGTAERVGITALCFLAISLSVSLLLARSLSRNIRALSSVAGRAARGDLSELVGVTHISGVPDEVDELANSINHLLQSLRDLVTHIQRTSGAVADSAHGLTSTADGVRALTDEVIASIGQISQGAERQSALVLQTSKIITEIASGIERTARAAEDAAIASNETASVAQSGSHVGKLAVDKLRKVFEKIEVTGGRVVRFGEKSKEISKIVEVITKLSQQTNLLALNAAIEAARAGEYGRGFAVVADEIRKLAENSASSADQIAKLIDESVGEALSAIKSVQESTRELADGREDMNSIIRSLDNITVTALKGVNVVSQISRITGDQLDGAQQMVDAIETISQVAASHALTTDEVSLAIDRHLTSTSAMTSSATQLNKLSKELENVVTQFQIKADNSLSGGNGP